jgi:hypothetical protein
MPLEMLQKCSKSRQLNNSSQAPKGGRKKIHEIPGPTDMF